MSIVLTVKDAYEVASVAGIADDPDEEYYRACGIMSKENLEAIIGENKVESTESNMYYAIEDDEDNELETDDDFDYIVNCFADDDFEQDEDYNGEYWVIAECEYKIKLTESATPDDIRKLKVYITKAADIKEENIKETRE